MKSVKIIRTYAVNLNLKNNIFELLIMSDDNWLQSVRKKWSKQDGECSDFLHYLTDHQGTDNVSFPRVNFGVTRASAEDECARH